MFGFIYVTTNTINGKRYLGMCSYHKRNYSTYLGSGKALKRAIRKYGPSSFAREIICEAATQEELSSKEIEFIKLYNCVEDHNWYNIASGGYTTRGFLGKKHSDETREKMRKNHKRILTPDGSKRIGAACKERIHKIQKPVTVTIDNVTYNSLKDAMDATGISFHNARKAAGLVKLKGNAPIICPHCKKSGKKSGMKKWHFDNCRHKPSSLSEIEK